MHIISNHC